MGLDEKACKNTDRELWREGPGDFYSPSIFVTEQGGIGINAGGTVIIKTLREWGKLAEEENKITNPKIAKPKRPLGSIRYDRDLTGPFCPACESSQKWPRGWIGRFLGRRPLGCIQEECARYWKRRAETCRK